MRSRLALELLPRTRCRSGQPEAALFGANGAVRVTSITCGNSQISSRVFKHLRDLGVGIHAGQQPLVFDNGIVGFAEAQEGPITYDNQSHSRLGPAAGSRKGQQTRSWQRPSRETQSFSTPAVEAVFGTELRLLSRHYSTYWVEDRHGLWVAVKLKPLGTCGPRAHLLIAVPTNRAITPRAWAFESIGATTKAFPLKHTNFPDASICAFTHESQAWVRDDGLLPLVDHYSLWMVKSWHRTAIGWWPGTQVGSCAFYRRMEFVGRELCGCGSDKRYADCHMFIDTAVPELEARRQFTRLFGCQYEDRQHPIGIIEAARTRFRNMPSMIAQSIVN